MPSRSSHSAVNAGPTGASAPSNGKPSGPSKGSPPSRTAQAGAPWPAKREEKRSWCMATTM
jgi:hypothetical protein